MLEQIEDISDFNIDQIIIVTNFNKMKKNKLYFYDNNTEVFETDAFIGINGFTMDKIEGDGKTPEGVFELGLAFGIHDIELDESIKYQKINGNLYWIDDIKSKYYNQLVDITKVHKDWNSAEHLIEYPQQYEYAIEIKTNSKNVPSKR